MIKTLDSSYSISLIPLLVDLGYPDQEPEALNKRIINFLSNSHSWLFGYFTDDELVGFASVSFLPLVHEDGYLGRVSALAVRRDFQRTGVGKKLMKYVEEFCLTRSCLRLELTSGAHRESTAHKFYNRLGYQRYSGARFVKALS